VLAEINENGANKLIIIVEVDDATAPFKGQHPSPHPFPLPHFSLETGFFSALMGYPESVKEYFSSLCKLKLNTGDLLPERRQESRCS
jgi:hypothetical protein